MLITVSTTHVPATDLGFLLHKNPARAQQVEVSHGTAHVFYPEADEHRCTVALLLEVDPVGLVRAARAGDAEGVPLAEYVNDRPYAASSLLAVALGRAFSSARRGVSKERPELAGAALPLEVHVPALSCRGGAEMTRRFFAPLGWRVEAAAVPLDDTLPEWGDSRYVDLRLSGQLRLADALNHLYVALPVLDDARHHWIGSDEIDKLLRAGSGWLAAHPDRELITRRYLGHRAVLTGRAIERLAEVDDVEADVLDDAIAPPVAVADGRWRAAGESVDGGVGDGEAAAGGVTDGGVTDGEAAAGGEVADRPVPLAQQRHGAVLAALRSAGAQRVVDLGCGAGALLSVLLADPRFTEVLGVDVSARALEVAARRLRLDRLPDRRRVRVRLLQSGLTYTDARLSGFDAAVLMEVVEHLDPDRLPALEHAVFAAAAPATVVVTTPNAEYNVRYEDLPAGAFRHRDHRFEWTRQEFADWTAAVGDRHGYGVRLLGVGDEDPLLGAPTQMAVFTRGAAAGVAA